MAFPREVIRANSFTIVRFLAVALILFIVAPRAALAAGAPDGPWDCAGPAGAAGAAPGADQARDCRAAATAAGPVVTVPPDGGLTNGGAAPAVAETAPGAGAAAAPVTVPEAAAASGDVLAADPSGPAPGNPAPGNPDPSAPEPTTAPNTERAAGRADEPLAREGSELPPAVPMAGGVPPAAGPGPAPAPAVTPDPIPAPTLAPPPTPVDLPRPPAWPREPEAARLNLPIPLVIDQVQHGQSGPSRWALPPLDRTGLPTATDPRVGAALGSLPAAKPREDQTRLHAGLPWDQCGLRVAGRRPGGVGRGLAPAADSQVPVDVLADRADYDRASEVIRLQGAIVITQGDQRLEADRSSYDRKSGAVNAAGNVFLDYPGARLQADTAAYNLQSKQGTLDQVHYRLRGGVNARGSADTAALLPGEITRYRDVTYTTCPPGQSDWSIRARDLELDQLEGMGTARHAQLRLGPVPLLYTPYLRFPIDDRRRSGFLIPVIGGGNNTGTDIILPYYWNIAPNLDATFYPRYMSSRGLMLGAQVRGLTRFGSAEYAGELMPHDDEAPDLGTRWSQRVTQAGAFGGRWSTAIDYSAVSDDQFLDDFGNRLDVTSIRNLTQRGSLAYGGNGFSVIAWLQSFQTVDATTTAANRPYGQLPHVQITLTPLHWGPAEFTLDGQYDYFDNPAKVYGNRAVLLSSVRLPLRRSFGFLIPRVRLYATAYDLLNQTEGMPARQDFLIPSLDLDTGLIFDRDTSWFGHPALQTLEPRLYYVLTPYANQADTPLFDTTALTFSYASLFRPNRFTGYDRIGDENRLTIGLTSRTLGGADGREWFRISLGEILYFGPRRVQLIGETADQESRSSIAGELSTNPVEGWVARASFQWDPNLTQNQWEQRVLQLRYAPGDDRLLNLSYRYSLGATEPERYENTDLSFRLPITPRVGLVGRWLYSLLQADTVEAFAGIEFGRCCWRVRVLGRHLKTSTDSAGNTSVMLQVELAGLGAFGDKIDKLLEQRIYGYDSD